MDGDDTNQRKDTDKYQLGTDEEVVFEVIVSREEQRSSPTVDRMKLLCRMEMVVPGW